MFPNKKDIDRYLAAKAASAAKDQAWREQCLACTSVEALAEVAIEAFRDQLGAGRDHPSVVAPWSEELRGHGTNWSEKDVANALQSALCARIDMQHVLDVVVMPAGDHHFFVRPHLHRSSLTPVPTPA